MSAALELARECRERAAQTVERGGWGWAEEAESWLAAALRYEGEAARERGAA